MSGNFLPPNTTREAFKANWDAYAEWRDWKDGLNPDYIPVYECDPENVLVWKGRTYQMPNPHPDDEDKAFAIVGRHNDLYRYTLYKLDQERKQDAKIAALSKAFAIRPAHIETAELVPVR